MFNKDSIHADSSDEPPSSSPDPLSSQGKIDSPGPSQATLLYQSSWPVILFVVGLDYLSTLAYQPSIAFGVAGRLAPFASLVVAFVTLFLTLPLYWYIAGRSPEGGGSTALLERLIPGWFGKFLILVLLGFGAVDLVLTRTFSATNAAEHILHSPTTEWQSVLNRSAVAGESAHRSLPESLQGWTEGLRHRQTAVTLLVLLISTAAGLLFFKGYSRKFVRVSFAVAVVYLALTLVVIGSGGFYLWQHRELLDNWWRAVSEEAGVREAAPTWPIGTLFGRCLPLFPFLALGLSGFELTLMAMPYIRGKADEHPQDRRGRIRNTRKLLVAAALLMCLYLLASTLISTVLIPAEAMTTHGQARDRTIAYLAHGGLLADGRPASEMNGLFGPIFGSIYDASTVLILALAGLSVALTLASWIPPYLCRLGMEFNWSVRLGLLAYLFIVVKIAVVVFFGADIEAQRYAYLTAVLAVFSFASFAALIDVYAKRKGKGWKRAFRFSPIFATAFIVFTLSGLQIASEQSAALVMSAAFILAVLGVSILSRLWRSTELRFDGFTFVDGESKKAWSHLCESDFPILIPIRPDGDSLVHKEQEIRTLHRIPNSLPIMFVQATVGDSSAFSQSPMICVTHENGRVLIQIMRCVSVPHALAAAALELSSSGAVPEVHFGWSNENPITANIHFVLFGSGNVPWMVYNLIQRAKVDGNRKPRVFVG